MRDARRRSGASYRFSRHTFCQLGRRGVRPLIDFHDEDERAARLQDSEDFAHVAGQVGPPAVRFHGSNQIEHAVRKRQLRRGAAIPRATPILNTILHLPARRLRHRASKPWSDGSHQQLNLEQRQQSRSDASIAAPGVRFALRGQSECSG